MSRYPDGTIERHPFGQLADGAPVSLFTLRGGAITVRITDYGGIITGILAPDRDGVEADVVLGFDTLAPYLGTHPYFGAIVGRYANRIAGGRFVLGGAHIQLSRNEGANHLHGGVAGFDRFLWDSAVEDGALVLRRSSPAGEQGYPGTLAVEVRYRVEGDSLSMVCSARTDAPTIVNLTQHSYFNLSGYGDILGHELALAASAYTPIDARLIPLGTLTPVAGTALDFKTAQPIGARIDWPDTQLVHGSGYDHNFVLDGDEVAARLYDPASGRVLELSTDQPGLQVYSGNFLDGSLGFPWRGGVCLEPQKFPNSPNVAGFPSAVLLPDEEYRHTSRYRFSIDLRR